MDLGFHPTIGVVVFYNLSDSSKKFHLSLNISTLSNQNLIGPVSTNSLGGFFRDQDDQTKCLLRETLCRLLVATWRNTMLTNICGPNSCFWSVK